MHPPRPHKPAEQAIPPFEESKTPPLYHVLFQDLRHHRAIPMVQSRIARWCLKSLSYIMVFIHNQTALTFFNHVPIFDIHSCTDVRVSKVFRYPIRLCMLMSAFPPITAPKMLHLATWRLSVLTVKPVNSAASLFGKASGCLSNILLYIHAVSVPHPATVRRLVLAA